MEHIQRVLSISSTKTNVIEDSSILRVFFLDLNKRFALEPYMKLRNSNFTHLESQGNEVFIHFGIEE